MQESVARRLGANIRTIRTARKLTQERLADRIGKSIGLVGQIERGEAMPSVDTLIDIIKALGVSPNGILGNLVPEKHFVSNEITKVLSAMDEAQQYYILDMVNRFWEFVQQENGSK